MKPQHSKWGEMSSQTEQLTEKLEKLLGVYTPFDIFENIFTKTSLEI